MYKPIEKAAILAKSIPMCDIDKCFFEQQRKND